MILKTCNIVTYFVSRSVQDGLPAGDFKAINKSAEYLFRCGHVQHIKYCSTPDITFIKADCLPEMRKDRTYKIVIGLEKSSFDIVFAVCGCPAGKGPSGSCKHIAALCYGLVEFCNLQREIPEYQTCTDFLQAWNKPRAKKVEPIPVDELGIRRRELTKPQKVSNVLFDPRPTNFRKTDSQELTYLFTDLINLPDKSAFTTILYPCADRIMCEHSYSQPTMNFSKDFSFTTYIPTQVCPYNLEEQQHRSESIIEGLSLTLSQIKELEEKTREQSRDPMWFEARRHRITGSKCGRILQQQNFTIPLLRSCLYPKPFTQLPKPIAWGREHEADALREYCKYMNANGHQDLQATKCGFVVHSTKPWLGASPDAWVYDPTCNSHGIAEFKCPYSKADVDPREACADSSFYCSIIDNKMHLNRNHSYYHQVQLQLYVSEYRSAFCDFCIYTLKGVLVERIHPDKQWQDNNFKIGQLLHGTDFT